MPLNKTITLTGSGSGATNSDPYRVNWRDSQTFLSFTTDGSTTGFTAQHTNTPPDGYASAAAWGAAATWWDVEDTVSGVDIAGVTADAKGVIDAPVHGVRLQADANGTDTGILVITQNKR